jgi:ankyrin repeat protein
MRQSCARLYLKFVADFVFHFFRICFLIFCSSDRQTALHLAARYDRTQARQLLIDAKADVNAADRCVFMFEICC